MDGDQEFRLTREEVALIPYCIRLDIYELRKKGDHANAKALEDEFNRILKEIPPARPENFPAWKELDNMTIRRCYANMDKLYAAREDGMALAFEEHLARYELGEPNRVEELAQIEAKQPVISDIEYGNSMNQKPKKQHLIKPHSKYENFGEVTRLIGQYKGSGDEKKVGIRKNTNRYPKEVQDVIDDYQKKGDEKTVAILTEFMRGIRWNPRQLEYKKRKVKSSKSQQENPDKLPVLTLKDELEYMLDDLPLIDEKIRDKNALNQNREHCSPLVADPAMTSVCIVPSILIAESKNNTPCEPCVTPEIRIFYGVQQDGTLTTPPTKTTSK
jgi:hypothetical protein